MDLSKPFETINHSLLLAKLDTHGFSKISLKLMQNCFCSRQQRRSINDSYSDWAKIVSGVLQGFILSPLLFNIFFNDIFMFTLKSNFCNYADDNTFYLSGKT